MSEEPEHTIEIEYTDEDGEKKTRLIPWRPPLHNPRPPGSGETPARIVKRAHRKSGSDLSLKKWALTVGVTHHQDKVSGASIDWIASKKY